MTEIILFLTIVSLSGLIGWLEYNNRKERKSFLNAILAKDNQEYVNSELADRTQIKAEKPKEPDLVPLDSLSDDEFDEMIQNQNL